METAKAAGQNDTYADDFEAALMSGLKSAAAKDIPRRKKTATVTKALKTRVSLSKEQQLTIGRQVMEKYVKDNDLDIIETTQTELEKVEIEGVSRKIKRQIITNMKDDAVNEPSTVKGKTVGQVKKEVDKMVDVAVKEIKVKKVKPAVKKDAKQVVKAVKNAPESKKSAKEMLYERLAAECTSKIATVTRDAEDKGYSLTIEMGDKREQIQYWKTDNHKHSIKIVNNIGGRGAKAKAAGIEQIHVTNTFKDIDYWVRKGSRDTFNGPADPKSLKKAVKDAVKETVKLSKAAPDCQVKDTAVSFKSFPVILEGEGTLKEFVKAGMCIAKSAKVMTVECTQSGMGVKYDFDTITGKQLKIGSPRQSWRIKKEA